MYSLFCFSFKHVRCIQRFQLLYELLHATFNILIMNYVSSRDKSVLLQLSLQNSTGLHVRLYTFEYHIHCSLSNAILCILLIGLQILSCKDCRLIYSTCSDCKYIRRITLQYIVHMLMLILRYMFLLL